MRPATPEERARIESALAEFGPEVVAKVVGDRAELWVKEGTPTTVHLVGRTLAAALRAAASRPAPAQAGLLVGEFRPQRIKWSLEGAYEIGRVSRVGRVVVNDKSAQLFLYGRDILGEGIQSVEPTVRERGVAFVANRRGEVLGVARVVGSLSGPGRALEPIVDRGWYLREGG